MFFAPHALVGASIASLKYPSKNIPAPASRWRKCITILCKIFWVVAFVFTLPVLSHFVLDHLPHHEYWRLGWLLVPIIGADILAFNVIVGSASLSRRFSGLEKCGIMLGMVFSVGPDILWCSHRYLHLNYPWLIQFVKWHTYFHTTNHEGFILQYLIAIGASLILWYGTKSKT